VIEPALDSSTGASDGGHDPWLGAVLGGKYRILRRLSRGGMGTVYEARHVIVERHFAIKILHAEYAARPRTVQRFVHEAKAAGALASEHIVAVYDFGDAAGTPYLVMELLRGQDLQQLLSRRGPLPVALAIGLALEVCRGLTAAHAAGLVHRDLKPANVFVLDAEHGCARAKLLDFGVAKLKNAETATSEHALVGTLGYMAPEQVLAGAHVDHRVDLYAVGVLLHEMLSGVPLHRGDQTEVLYGILHGKPPALDDVRDDLPHGLASVVARALAREPDDRHAGATELANALRPFAREAIVHPSSARYAAEPATAGDATRPDEEERDGSLLEARPVVPALMPTTDARGRRRRVAARAALLLLGAATLWLYLGDAQVREALRTERIPALAATQLSAHPAPALAQPPSGAVHATAVAMPPAAEKAAPEKAAPEKAAPEKATPEKAAATSSIPTRRRGLLSYAPSTGTSTASRAPRVPQTRDLPAPSSRFDRNNPYVNAKP
jgi:hypothetical protein